MDFSSHSDTVMREDFPLGYSEALLEVFIETKSFCIMEFNFQGFYDKNNNVYLFVGLSRCHPVKICVQ